MLIKPLVRSVVNRLLKPLGVELNRAGLSETPINDGAYWDRYVREWKRTAAHQGLTHVGDEWKHQEVFVDRLRRYASPEHTALEIGCGGGRITAVAHKLFDRVHACDVSHEMLLSNARVLGASNVTYHHIDGFTLDGFADASVDLVFSHDVFVHFSSLQVYPYFAEMRRVLRPGGIGLVSFYCFTRHFSLFKEMARSFNERRVFPPHMRIHFVTEEMIHLMLRDLNLEVQELDRGNFLVVTFRRV